MNARLAELAIRLADDHLMLGHRLSQWCGHAPVLEEDLALPNIALDLIGQARELYTYAGFLENKGRDEDEIAYLRSQREYRNCLLAARPNGDFAHTMLKILYFSAFMEPYWRVMCSSSNEMLAAIAGKAVKEATYHIRHSGEWVIRLGDGTTESARRMNEAVTALGPYVDELFEADETVSRLVRAGIAPDPTALRAGWEHTVAEIFREAGIEMTKSPHAKTGGRRGMHEESMGLLLAELQYMQRTYPGQRW